MCRLHQCATAVNPATQSHRANPSKRRLLPARSIQAYVTNSNKALLCSYRPNQNPNSRSTSSRCCRRESARCRNTLLSTESSRLRRHVEYCAEENRSFKSTDIEVVANPSSDLCRLMFCLPGPPCLSFCSAPGDASLIRMHPRRRRRHFTSRPIAHPSTRNCMPAAWQHHRRTRAPSVSPSSSPPSCQCR